MEKSSQIVSSVIEDLKRREEKGVKEYGTTMDREDLTMEEWLDHLYEELLDAALYNRKLKELIKTGQCPFTQYQ